MMLGPLSTKVNNFCLLSAAVGPLGKLNPLYDPGSGHCTLETENF